MPLPGAVGVVKRIRLSSMTLMDKVPKQSLGEKWRSQVQLGNEEALIDKVPRQSLGQ